MKRLKFLTLATIIGGAMAVTAACGSDNAAEKENGTTNGTETALQGDVLLDGSSTVFPIMEAVSEEYMAVQPDVKVSVGTSGTGGGFEKFSAGETDLSNASRPIKDEEKAALEKAGIDFTEIEIAYDGLSVVVNKENDFVDSLTVDELKKIWLEDGSVKKWSDIRAEWPAEEIKFYSPGSDSGTYDYFDEVILEEQPLAKTATLSEDDNVLVQGVAGDKNAIGYFGFAYYLENQDKLKVIPIDNGNGPIEPNLETIQSGEYAPLSRPLFTYVANKAVAEKEQVADFAKFAIENAGELAEEVGYVALPEEKYQEGLDKITGLEK